jgi:hypothetical protein
MIVGAGVVLIVIGALVWLGGFSWFGRLPGDVRIERDTVRVYIPLVSMLVVSVALTLLLNLIRRFF